MKEITIHTPDGWDYANNEFVEGATYVIEIEHSLISIHKWEQKWHVPYLSKLPQKTAEQNMDYIRCMLINPKRDISKLQYLNDAAINDIVDYITDPMSATTIIEDNTNGTTTSEAQTAEMLYYAMIQHNIPIEFQKWHLNSLITLIRLCNVKSNPPKPMSKEATMARYAEIRKQNEEKIKRMNNK